MQDNLGLFENSVGVKRICSYGEEGYDESNDLNLNHLPCTFRETFDAKDKIFDNFIPNM